MQKILLTTTFLTVFHLVQAQLTVQGDSLINLGKYQLQLSKQGFPEQIDSLLAENVHFHFFRASDGKDIRLTSDGVHFTRRDRGNVEWNVTNASDELRMEVVASLRADGHLSYKVTVTALQDLDIKDITMHIPFQPEKAKEMKGLGLKGGARPDSNYSWKWETGQKGPAGAWIGGMKGGLQYSLEPGAWNNEGKGGIIVGIKGKSMLVNNYSGPRHLLKGDSLHFNFDLAAMSGKGK